VVELLSQALEDGTLTDAQGQVASLRSATVVITSTASPAPPASAAAEGGAPAPAPAAGDAAPGQLQLPRAVMRLAGRVDVAAALEPLGAGHMRSIVEAQLASAATALAGAGLALRVDPSAAEWLARAGLSPAHGARPLAKLIHNLVLSQALDAALARPASGGGGGGGGTVHVRLAPPGRGGPEAPPLAVEIV
jgi:ATP-dependent Clp protease ATP-binding subunit ClpA